MQLKPTDRAPAPVIQVRGLHVILDDDHIIDDLDLTVAQGEVLAVLGANGSGKSTLVKSLVGTITAADGSIQLFGRTGRDIPWDRIGYVPQRVGAQSGIAASAQEIVASGLLGPRRLRKPSDWTARTAAALEKVGLAHRANSAMHELSGGQQQRVLIARALVRNPELLILDEPVAGVDQPSQQTFAKTLGDLIAHGVTIVVVLHELGDLANLITRTIVLDRGRIVRAQGPLDRQQDDGPPHDHVHPHCDPETGALASVLPEPTLDPSPTQPGRTRST